MNSNSLLSFNSFINNSILHVRFDSVIQFGGTWKEEKNYKLRRKDERRKDQEGVKERKKGKRGRKKSKMWGIWCVIEFKLIFELCIYQGSAQLGPSKPSKVRNFHFSSKWNDLACYTCLTLVFFLVYHCSCPLLLPDITFVFRNGEPLKHYPFNLDILWSLPYSISTETVPSFEGKQLLVVNGRDSGNVFIMEEQYQNWVHFHSWEV